VRLNPAAVIAVLVAAAAAAAQPMARYGPLWDVRVSGNERIDAIQILDWARFCKPGATVGSLDLRDDIQAVYERGFFSDVAVELTREPEGDVLTFVVAERPGVSAIVFEGNKKVRDSRLAKEMTLKPGDIYDEARVSSDLGALRRLYREKGYHRAALSGSVEPAEEPGEVVVRVTIDERKRARIKRIRFENNRAVSDRRLRWAMKTRESRFLRAKVYDPAVFSADLESVERFYHDEGYLRARVTDYWVQLDPKRKHVYISISVEEGPRYTVSSVDFVGNTIITNVEMLAEMEAVPGEVYGPASQAKDERAVYDLHAELGYIRAQVTADPVIDDASRTVALTYTIEENPRVYVERVDVHVYNPDTSPRSQDLVVRREVRVRPGEPFNMKAVGRTRQRLSNLGYFGRVDVTRAPGSSDDRQNLVIRLEEKLTRNLIFSAGYHSEDRLFGAVEMDLLNFDWRRPPSFSGAGEKLSLRARFSSERTDYDLGFTKPYIFETRWTAGADLYDSRVEYDEYDQQYRGFKLRGSHPLGEYTWARLSYRYQDIELSDIDDLASDEIKLYEGTWTTQSVGLGIVHDTRDNRFDPTEGHRDNWDLEVAGGPIGGDEDFWKMEAATSWYRPLFEPFILNVRLSGGLVDTYGDSTDRDRDNDGDPDGVPIWERFFLGGGDTVRGYPSRDISPRDPGTNDRIGGGLFLLGNIEILFPIVENVKGSIFYDAGNVWSERGDADLNDPFDGVGVGVRLATPVGPIRLDYGYGLDRNRGRVHFSMGWSY